MKKILLAFGLMCAATFAQAQYYSVTATNIGFNPGNLHLEQEQPPAFMTGNYSGYTQIMSTGASTWSASQNIPFSFEFNGTPVTSYSVAPSGVLSFSTVSNPAPSDNNIALPTSQIPDNSICAWGVNVSGGNDGVVVKTFGEAPRRQHWIIWASASFPTMGATGWTNWGIVLEESTNHIYVVDLRTYDGNGGNVSLTVGVQIDSNEAYQLGASPNVESNTTATGGSNAFPDDNTYYLFGQGSQPNAELDNISISTPYYLEVNQAATISGLIVNHGSSAVTSAQITYTAGSANVTDNLTGLNIAPGTSYEYSLPTDWTPTVSGAETIETTVDQSNGNNESITANNTFAKEVLVVPGIVPRKPLLEQFTSSTCAPCLPGNANVLSVMSSYTGEFSKVNYQMSWPGSGDPYFTLEGQDRRTFYGVNSVPSMHTDGSAGLNSQSYTSTMFEDAQDVPSFVNLVLEGSVVPMVSYEIVNGELEETERIYKVTASAEINPIIEMPSGLRTFLVVNEDLTYDNVKTNGETEFHDVMKKMLPNSSGVMLGTIAANATFTVEEDYTFAEEYRLPNDAGDPINHSIEHSVEEWNDLRLVAWVQDPNTGEVWQSENLKLEVAEEESNVTTDTVDGVVIITVDGVDYESVGGKLYPQGTEDVFASNVSVFPNPANNVLNISGASSNAVVTMFDMTGRMVMNQPLNNNGINVGELPAGIYNMVVIDNDKQANKRVSIVH
ncbi:MAG: T9SS type A sorting domain-containing protein [Salibacteraceae bacterium]